MDKEKAKVSLTEDYAFIKNKYALKGYDILGVFLYGSQNYNVDTPSSDFDSMAILIPSIENLITKPNGISTTYFSVGEDNHQIIVKDIATFNRLLYKGSITSSEILFSKACITNFFYEDTFENYYLNNKEIIALINPLSLYRSVLKQIQHLPKSETRYMNDFRMVYTLKKLQEGQSFEEALYLDKVTAASLKTIKERGNGSYLEDWDKLITDFQADTNLEKFFMDLNDNCLSKEVIFSILIRGATKLIQLYEENIKAHFTE